MVLGHEITGEILEKGRDVEFLNVGDLVSAPFNGSEQEFDCLDACASLRA